MSSADNHLERGRTRSTCGKPWDVHGSHDWNKGDARLWCPGTDGSNPQIPDDLKRELRESRR
jgi:hypothetical protein